jgi:hypothetical protein
MDRADSGTYQEASDVRDLPRYRRLKRGGNEAETTIGCGKVGILGKD